MLDTPTIEPIAIQVSDRVDGQTRFMQVAHSYKTLMLDQPDGSVWLEYTLQVRPHAITQAGELGTANPFGYPDRLEPLLADNNTAVNPATGELRYISKVHDVSCTNVRTGEVITYGPKIGWLAFLEALPERLMLQGFFYAQMRNNPVVLSNMLIQNIQQADAMGKFA